MIINNLARDDEFQSSFADTDYRIPPSCEHVQCEKDVDPILF